MRLSQEKVRRPTEAAAAARDCDKLAGLTGFEHDAVRDQRSKSAAVELIALLLLLKMFDPRDGPFANVTGD